MAPQMTTSLRPEPSSTWPGAGLALVCAGALFLLVGLGRTDLWAPDEPRCARVAEELYSMEHGARGLVVLHLNGEPYTQKPPLFYWLVALASLPGDAVSELSVRLPSALAGIALLLVALGLGSRLFDARVACWATALLLTVFDFAFLARRGRLDVLLAFWVALALLGFWRLDRGVGSARRNAMIFHGAMGLGVLTKGPAALLPLLVATLYLAWERRLGTLRRALPPAALLLSLAPGLVWITAAVLLTPAGFFGEAVVDNLYGRVVTGTAHVEPIYFFLYQFPLNFLPWTLLWPLVFLELRDRARQPPEQRQAASSWRFLLAWVATYFVFFSLSAGKRGLYLLPAFLPAALLCAASLESWLRRRSALPRWLERGVPAAFATLGGIGLVLAVIGGFDVPGLEEVRIPAAFFAALAGIALGAAGAWRGLGRRGGALRLQLAACLAAIALLELSYFTLLLPAFDPEKSPRPIAEDAAALASPGESIGVYRHPTILGGLAFYSKHHIVRLEPGEVEAFLERGGRIIASRAEHLAELEQVTPFEVHASHRSRGRRYLVLTPAPPPPAPTPRVLGEDP
jgi:4-amino-4-deoxy-L-arabinose transferase-like glycosyltransferase